MARVANTTLEQRLYQTLKRLPNDPEIAAVVLVAYLTATGGADGIAAMVRSRTWPGASDDGVPADMVRKELARPEVRTALAAQTPNARRLTKILPWAIENLRSAKRREPADEWWPLAQELVRSMAAVAQWSAATGEDLSAHSIRSASRAAMAWLDTEGPEARDRMLGPVVCTFADGYTIQMLSTPALLAYEGEVMGHCIGGYWDDVANKKAIFFSLREPSGRSQVTMTLEVTKYPDELSIPELQARANTRPKAHDVARVAAFAQFAYGWRPPFSLDIRALRIEPELLQPLARTLKFEAFTLPLNTLAERFWINLHLAGGSIVGMAVRSPSDVLVRIYQFFELRMGIPIPRFELSDDDDPSRWLDVGEWGRHIELDELYLRVDEVLHNPDAQREFAEWYEEEYGRNLDCRTVLELYAQAIPVPLRMADDACMDDFDSHTLDLNAARWYAYGALEFTEDIRKLGLVRPQELPKLGDSVLAAVHDGNVVADLRLEGCMSADEMIDLQDTIADEVEYR